MTQYIDDCVCESCDCVRLCIQVADDCVLCESCFATHEKIVTEIEDEISRDSIDWSEYEASDEADMYGCDYDNDIAMGRYDE